MLYAVVGSELFLLVINHLTFLRHPAFNKNCPVEYEQGPSSDKGTEVSKYRRHLCAES